MQTIKLFDTLSRSIRDFIPNQPAQVDLYSCGPTVYDLAHIGNLRTYIFVDLLKRVLWSAGYQVNHAMNITDVGHLVSDADSGEDKMEKGSRQHNLSAWDIAKKFEGHFFEDSTALNIIRPNIVCRATEHINEQIVFIQDLEAKGYTYTTSDGVYFDSTKDEQYGYLARLKAEGLQQGMRVAMGEKRSLTDFALWKFNQGQQRQMQWHSPWGAGFPGWHIECSAMAEKYLGKLFDIHTGGEDHIAVHHSNEIAQTKARHGTTLANYWLHGYFLQIDNAKVAKSGKSLTLRQVQDKGFLPLSYRYLVLTAHYRSRLNFTWESLQGAQKTLARMKQIVNELPDGGQPATTFCQRFDSEVRLDLNTAKGLSTVWLMLRSNTPDKTKKANVLYADKILGLSLSEGNGQDDDIPHQILQLAQNRDQARLKQNWALADQLRAQIEQAGYTVEDDKDGYSLKPQ